MAEIRYSIYQQPKVGCAVSGDAYLIQESGPNLLVCLADGLGSGPLAAEASQAAVGWVSAHPQASLSQLTQGCHEAMRYTRGAALALMRVDAAKRELSFVGVGNVEFHAWSAKPMRPISYQGIVGSRLPSLHEFCFPLSSGDTIMLHTDGVSRRFVNAGLVERSEGASPHQLVEMIAAGYAKRNDDATLIVLSFTSNSNHNEIEVIYDENLGS